jgi:aspartate/methionine/tyrosine aminotransferase
LLAVGNPEACFYARMRAIFMENHTTLMAWLDMLERSATIGHDVAAFVLSLVLHKSNSGADNDNIAQRWLRKANVIK